MTFLQNGIDLTKTATTLEWVYTIALGLAFLGLCALLVKVIRRRALALAQAEPLDRLEKRLLGLQKIAATGVLTFIAGGLATNGARAMLTMPPVLPDNIAASYQNGAILLVIGFGLCLYVVFEWMLQFAQDIAQEVSIIREERRPNGNGNGNTGKQI